MLRFSRLYFDFLRLVTAPKAVAEVADVKVNNDRKQMFIKPLASMDLQRTSTMVNQTIDDYCLTNLTVLANKTHLNISAVWDMGKFFDCDSTLVLSNNNFQTIPLQHSYSNWL